MSNPELQQQFVYGTQNVNMVSAEIGRSVILSESYRKIIAVTMALDLESCGVLFDGPPGVGKTTAARSAAVAIGGTYRRIQCTPDLQPFDITGPERPNADRTSFDWVPGPINYNVVLADEVSRLTPRAQSALLEAMQEGQATVGNITHPLPKPHRVIATQNPGEHQQGTYPLNMANSDRFITSVDFPYLSEDDRILAAIMSKHEPQQVVGSLADYAWSGQGIEFATVEPDKMRRANRILTSLSDFEMVEQEDSNVRSTRALPQLLLVAKGLAMYDGVQNVTDTHVDEAAIAVLRHRVGLTDKAVDGWGETPEHAVGEAIGYSYDSWN